MNLNERTVVIGGGLGGLTAACTLAARGYHVTLIERNNWLGGKAVSLERDGFRFDMGPTILTLPSVLRKVFEEAKRDIDDYLNLIRLDPQWRCFFSDGNQFDLVESIDQMKTNLRAFTGGDRSGAGFEKFMQVSERLHDVSDRFFFWKSVGGIRDTMNVKESFSLQVLSDVLSLRFGRTVAGLVRSNIPDPRIAQMVDHFTQYVGSSPEAIAGSSVRHCSHANDRRDLVSRWRNSSNSRCSRQTRNRVRCGVYHGQTGGPHSYRWRTRFRSPAG